MKALRPKFFWLTPADLEEGRLLHEALVIRRQTYQ
jgi:hypothetical protein